MSKNAKVFNFGIFSLTRKQKDVYGYLSKRKIGNHVSQQERT